MSKGKECFQAVCDAPDLEAAVASLSPKHWRELYGYLLRTYDVNAVSGQVLGMMSVEGAKRYASDSVKRNQVKEVLG